MERLAVYGTLRSGFGLLAELGVEHALVSLGPCELPGLLVDLGDYPGLLEGPGRVEAELFAVRDASVFERLDAYEDARASDPMGSLFVRRWMRLARPALGAWVYVYARDASGRPIVASGCWTTHVAGRTAEALRP